jgi:hypothetical protein
MADTLAGDIKAARDAGVSDDVILERLQKTDPHLTEDIGAATKAGVDNSTILTRLGEFGSKEAPRSSTHEPSMIEKGAGTVVRAAEKVIAGPVKTYDALAGTDNASKVLAVIPDAPEGTAPAEMPRLRDLENNWSSVGNYAKGVAKVIAENPQIAADLAGGAAGARVGALAGPIGAGVGGVLGAGAAHFLWNGGEDAERARVARLERSPDSGNALSTSDLVAAGANAAVQGPMGRLGLSLPFVGRVAGGLGVPGVAAKVGEAALGATALGAGSSAADQALIERRIDPEKVLDAGAMSGVAGAGTAATAGMVRDVNAARVAKKIGLNIEGPEGNAARSVAQDLRDSGVDTPEASARAIKKADITYKVDHDANLGQVQNSLKEAQATGLKMVEVEKALKRTEGMLKAGESPIPADLDTLKNSALPGVGDLIETARKRDALSRITQAGKMTDNGFEGGLGTSETLHRFNNIVGSIGVWNLIHNPQHVTASALAYLGQKGAVKALDAISGSNNPAKLIVERYAPMQAESLSPLGTPRSIPQMGGSAPPIPDATAAAAPPTVAPTSPVAPPRSIQMTHSGSGMAPDAAPATPVAAAPKEGILNAPYVKKSTATGPGEGVMLTHEFGNRFEQNITHTPAAAQRGYTDRNNARAASWDALQDLDGLTSSEKSALAADRLRAMKGANKVETRELLQKVAEKRIAKLVQKGKLSKKGASLALTHLFTRGRKGVHGGAKYSFLGSIKR